MLNSLRSIDASLKGLDKSVRELTTKQVFKASVKEDACQVVDNYFREVRDRLAVGGVDSDTLLSLDRDMHELLEMSRKNSAVQTYRSQIKKMRKHLLSAEKSALNLSGTHGVTQLEEVDRMIINTLTSLLPSAARSYEQAMRDLRSADRLSWRGPATDLRESLRETLDHLAPDKDVVEQPGFKLEKDTTAPTMKQKVRFIMRKRGTRRSAAESPEAAAQAVDEIVGTFVRSVYRRSSVSTHTPTDRNEVLRIRDWVRVALCELLAIRVGA